MRNEFINDSILMQIFAVDKTNHDFFKWQVRNSTKITHSSHVIKTYEAES